MKTWRQRIPKIPHWRWIVFIGDNHPEWDDRFNYMVELEPHRKNLGVPTKIDDKLVNWFSSKPIRRVLEDLIIERCSKQVVINVLRHKFRIEAKDYEVTEYKKVFFDIKHMSMIDLDRYWSSLGYRRAPMPPPVPGAIRADYEAFKNGALVKLNHEDVLNQIIARTFFRSQEISKRLGVEGEEKAAKLNKTTIEAIRALREINVNDDLPEGFDYEVEYPEETATTVDTLLNMGAYDPELDPNDTEEANDPVEEE